jgi:hypothetical protein
MKSDEDKVYIKIIDLEASHFCLNMSLGQNY